MRCVSTRSPGAPGVPLSEAISQGLAPDGGLFVPVAIPEVQLAPGPLPQLAARLLAPYFADELLGAQLEQICAAAFTFDAPLVPLGSDRLLELFHGPTAAFKDFGARFLSECLTRLGAQQTILVATSGDTGAAVAAAFHRRPGMRVVILYPKGRVSARQEHQLGAFGDNVHAFRVSGTFDDCQRMVKAALADPPLRSKLQLGSANSISLGRLLPQMAYFARAALEVKAPVNFVVPTGNLGNALACLMAKQMGLPIGRIVLATNANRGLPDFFQTGTWEPRPSIVTLANAMDVGAPSNLERLRYWKLTAEADWVDDDTIRSTIRRTWEQHRLSICPHTACGVEVLRRLKAEGADGTWIVAATAHPAKFETIVEPLIGQRVPVPPALQQLLDRPSSAEPLDPTDAALISRLGSL
ncbi:MAG: threonine synthase [Myxococcaceae bacterium]|nr:threonine synthase [Myxococcaceae bacterium]